MTDRVVALKIIELGYLHLFWPLFFFSLIYFNLLEIFILFYLKTLMQMCKFIRSFYKIIFK